MLACAGEPEAPPPPPVDRSAAVAAAVALVEGTDGREGPAAAGRTGAKEAPFAGPPVEIVLVWHGISSLYRSFFSHREAVTPLSTALSGHVSGPANVHIRYDAEAFVGQLRLQLRPGTRVVPVPHQGSVIDLQALSGITEALGSYRRELAGRFDVRIANFDVGIEATRAATSCTFGIVGDPPADGRVLSPCVEINGKEACGQPTPTGVSFLPETAKNVRRCLDL
jgi:hypothetical protein